jgi:hypothetical protein
LLARRIARFLCIDAWVACAAFIDALVVAVDARPDAALVHSAGPAAHRGGLTAHFDTFTARITTMNT